MKCLYIYNPKSGREKAEKKKNYIIKQLSSVFSQLEVVKTDHAGQAKGLAEKACGKFDYIVVAGGDGTLNEVVNGIAEKANQPKIGYIPLGTINDFAHSMGIPRSIKGAVKTICNGQTINHEIFKVNDRYGIYVCALGVASETSYATNQKAKNILGKLAYFLHGVKKIFRTDAIPLTIEFEGGIIKDNFALMLAINSKYVGSFKLNKYFVCNDGFVDVMLITEKRKRVSFSCLLAIAKLCLFGIDKQKPKRATMLRLNSFTVTAPQDVVINLDGENVGSGKFDLKVLQDGIQIIVPKKKVIKATKEAHKNSRKQHSAQ